MFTPAVQEYLDAKEPVEVIAARYGLRVSGLQGRVHREKRRAGLVKRRPRTGDKRGPVKHNWKGGRVKDKHGYVLVWVDLNDSLAVQMMGKQRYLPEHRLVMARHLNRPLTSTETVHHKDGNKTNNDISNLQLRQGRHGKGVVLVCRCCGSSDIEAREL